MEQLQQMHIPMAVVTSKTTATCLRGARCLGIDKFFVTVIGSDIVTHPKPDAEPTRMALEKLGTRSEETLCVGDAPFDIMSGRAAGCKTVAVKYTQVAREKFTGMAKPDGWIEDITDLLSFNLREGER